MPFSHFFIDKFIAPDLSGIVDSQLKSLSNCSDLLSAFLLNFTFRVRVNEKIYALSVNYLSRVTEASLQYNLGIEVLARFLPRKNSDPSSYYLVLHRFESCIAMAWQARCLLVALYKELTSDISAPFQYKSGDGSIDDRLNGLYNDSKHADSRISNGFLPPNGTVAVWLTNDGFKSSKNTVSYDELHFFVVRLVKYAEFMAMEWPEQLLQEYAKNGDPPADEPYKVPRT